MMSQTNFTDLLILVVCIPSACMPAVSDDAVHFYSGDNLVKAPKEVLMWKKDRKV